MSDKLSDLRTECSQTTLNGRSELHFDWLVSLALQTITRIETE